MDVKRDAENIQRDKGFLAVNLEGRLDYLLGGQRDIMQRLREDEREMDDVRDKSELPVRYIDEADGIVREAREIQGRLRDQRGDYRYGE